MTTMTRTIFAALALAAATAGADRPAQAAHWWPWCSQYLEPSQAESCAFESYDQCMQTVNGIGGYCFRNRWPAPSSYQAPMSRAERVQDGRKPRIQY